MPIKNAFPLRSKDFEIYKVSGRILTAGTGAMSVADGSGFTVARDGVGTATITFDEVGAAMHSMQVTEQWSALDDVKVQFGDYDASAKTLVMRAITGATGLAVEWPAADANNSVSICIEFRNTGVVP